MAIRLRRRAVVKIRSFVALGLTYATIGFLWEILETGQSTVNGATVGLAIGLALAAFDTSKIASVTRSMSFTSAVLLKSLLYLIVIAVPTLLIGFFGGLIQGLQIADFFAWIFSAELPLQLVLVYLIHLIVVFVRHLNRLLGPRTLFRYLSGTYHHPKIEKRIFLFLDLKSSTMLAETLGGEAYFDLLNTFFRDISELILERGAEIYQYIGDEVVLTWPVELGLRDANCIRVFIEILAEIHSRKDYYQQRFNHVPEFKAGVHFGDVITAEIGDLKKEIVYNGDVLNTTARIQTMCNKFNQRLIASEALVAELALPSFIESRSLGKVELRGKAAPLELVALI